MLAYNSDHKYITKVFAHCYMDNMHMHMEYDWQWWWHRTKCEHYLSHGSKHHRTHRTKYKHYLSLSQNTTEHTDTEQSVSIIWAMGQTTTEHRTKCKHYLSLSQNNVSWCEPESKQLWCELQYEEHESLVWILTRSRIRKWESQTMLRVTSFEGWTADVGLR